MADRRFQRPIAAVVRALSVAALLFAMPTSPAAAAPFLNIDFQSAAATNTQAGFSVYHPSVAGGSTLAGSSGAYAVPYTVSDPSFSGGTGTVTIVLANTAAISGTTGDLSGGLPSGNTRTVPTGNASFTYGNLYADFGFGNNSSGDTGIEVKGLNPNTAYRLTFYTYDHMTSRTQAFFDITNGGNVSLGSISTTSNTVFTSNDQFTIVATRTTDSTGRLLFKETPTSGTAAVINGLQIEAPEPTGLLVLGAARAPAYITPPADRSRKIASESSLRVLCHFVVQLFTWTPPRPAVIDKPSESYGCTDSSSWTFVSIRS